MTFKRLLLIFLLIGLNAICFAQNNNMIIASAKYKVSYIKDKEIIIDDICQLDITKMQSYFYSLGYKEQFENISSKLEKAKATGNIMNFERGEIKTNLYKFNTVKDYKNKVALVSERIGSQYLAFVKDSLSTRKWKIVDEKTKINNLVCQKAISVSGKVNVVVWFAKDIPITEGPFYYYGLPGLIVKAVNSLGWEANLLSVQYNKDSKNEIFIEPYKLVSEAMVVKAKANVEQSKSNNGVISMPDGSKLKKGN
jgi:GLPGLI family protein